MDNRTEDDHGTATCQPDRQGTRQQLHRRRVRESDLPRGGAVADDRQPGSVHPGARTNWHSHAVGQTLHVTDGIGLVATRDGMVIRMRAGDTVYTSPGEEHWHGGTADNLMCHLAMLESTESGDGTTWLEPVTDEQYATANQS
jgi:mannose-6-phosphate isomerase-like protein (cupin superfamily)